MRNIFIRALSKTLRRVGYEVRRDNRASATAKAAYRETHARLFAEMRRQPKHFGHDHKPA